jgi:anti-sigma factor RsiW
MDCRKIRIKLGEFVDKTLPDTEDREIEEHLQHCNDCRKVVMEFMTVVQLAEKDVAPPLSPWITQRLMNKIDSQAGNSQSSNVWFFPVFRWRNTVAYSMIVAAGILIGIIFFNRNAPEATRNDYIQVLAKQYNMNNDDDMDIFSNLTLKK